MIHNRLVIRRLFSTATSSTGTATPTKPQLNVLANSAASKLKQEGVKIGGVRGDGQSPRWYKDIQVAVAPVESTRTLYTVKMDNKKLNTPKENVLAVPSQILAKAIAAEWEAQDTLIKPSALPITRLATAALDLIPMYRAEIVENLVNALKTDAACCREAETGDLYEQQDKTFKPMLEWFKERFGIAPKVSFAFGPIQQPEYLLSAVRDYISSLDDYHVAALEQITNTAKSLVIALGLLNGKLSVENAIKAFFRVTLSPVLILFTAARLEEDFQTDKWGLVQGGHDLDRADLAVKVSSGALFWRLLSQP